MPAPRKRAADRTDAARADDPLWYKHAVIYQAHVRAFYDSNGDGIGDFNGLLAKLDYLQDLGVSAVWILPFYPSPLRDDGYDIAQYAGVHESYGTMKDAARFIGEAHRRGLRVITEMVLNHTSDQHQWFQRARRAPAGSRHRDFYVWSDSAEKYAGTRVIFKDFEPSNWSWDPIAKAYYWHRFYAHQPDLNFDSPVVQEEMLKIVDHWLDAGVDGIRLDAVPYLFEREGTSCENLPETHEFLRKLRAHVDRNYHGRMLLAEANQWPEDAVAYFGGGDECHMAFHFPVMPRLFMAVRMEDRFPVIDILNQTPAIPPTCQWAMFLRNHDELTLEMVTDEERDYMYRVYASDPQARINLGVRRRLAPLLENSRRKIELMNALLFSLTGTPVIYYGDEIGMGDNIYLGDRNGVRTPMQWSADRNAGFSGANPQKLFLPIIIDPEYHYEAINVEAQRNNPTSLLWWMKRLIALRKRYTVFGDGAIEFPHAENHKVLAFLRHNDQQHVLVVANLSRFVQAVAVDLSRYRGWIPVEMFGLTRFPPIGEAPYFLSLGPHGFYWFALEPPASIEPGDQSAPPQRAVLPALRAEGDPHEWFASEAGRGAIARVLARDAPGRRWFRSKAARIRDARLVDAIPLRAATPNRELSAAIFILEFAYVDTEPESYAIPLALAAPGHAGVLPAAESPAAVALVTRNGGAEQWMLYDGMVDPAVCAALLELMLRRRQAAGERGGRIAGSVTKALRATARAGTSLEALTVHVCRAEQSNSSVTFGKALFMKLFRKVEAGENPELEVGRHFARRGDRAAFAHAPELAGALEYQPGAHQPQTLAILQRFVPNEGDAWRQTLDELGRYYDRVQALGPGLEQARPRPPRAHLFDLGPAPPSPRAQELIGEHLHLAELLGKRTAEMHLALADAQDDPAFAPEPFTLMYQRSLYQSLRNSAHRSLQLLRGRRATLPEGVRDDADALLGGESDLLSRLREVTRRRLGGMRIRCHGDYHLGQVLWTGKDFQIIDFEGEPGRPLGERRLKRTPLRDVAGMLRSFDYAARTALREEVARGSIGAPPADIAWLAEWAEWWQIEIGRAFLHAYLRVLAGGNATLLPADDEGIFILLRAWMLEKAMYEIAYELNNRPDWLALPLGGALRLLSQ